MATKLKQKRDLVKTLSQMGLTTAKNLGGIANIEGKSNVDLLVSIPNSVSSILSDIGKTTGITGLLNIDEYTAVAAGSILPNFFGVLNQLASITVTNSGNNYSALSNVVIENQNTTGASANLVIHYKLKEIYGGFELYDNNSLTHSENFQLQHGGTIDFPAEDATISVFTLVSFLKCE